MKQIKKECMALKLLGEEKLKTYKRKNVIGFKYYDPSSWFNTFYLNEVYAVDFWRSDLLCGLVGSTKNGAYHGVSFTKIIKGKI